MKKLFKVIMIICAMGLWCMPALADALPLEEQSITIDAKDITNYIECSEEDYVAAIARDKGLTMEEAWQTHLESKATYNNARVLPFSEKYYDIEKVVNIPNSDYKLQISAIAYVLVDNGNFGHVCEVLDVMAPYITIDGPVVYAMWDGTADPRHTSDSITIFFNGNMYIDVSTSISVSGGTGFIDMGFSSSTTRRYQYPVRSSYTWGLSDI